MAITFDAKFKLRKGSSVAIVAV